jgi:metal-dependent amidase/aminoacylase/carboxypeptidase family protein
MRARYWSNSSFVIITLACVAGGAQAQSALLAPFTEKLESERARLVDLRHDLHLHPETSGKEERTAGLVAERLRAAGYEVRTGVGGHGVIGVLRGGKPGPVVAYRADMDAVPSDAPDPVDFRSLTPGVRHICGHDLHTTIGVALAQGLASIEDRVPGTVMFVFQPAEEIATGAKAMLAERALDHPKPDAIFAVHTAPFNVGQIVTAPGGLMAGRDGVWVTIQRAPDAAATANAVRDRIQALSTISGPQLLAPAAPDFVYVQSEVRPPTGADTTYTVEASITMASQDVRSRTHAAVEAAVAELRNDDTQLALRYEERFIAGVTNDPDLVQRATTVIDSVLGQGSVTMLDAVVPAFSEDFGSFQALVPGVMFFLGVSNPEKGIVGMPHSPGYAADDEAIFVGAKAMAAVLLDFLEAR